MSLKFVGETKFGLQCCTQHAENLTEYPTIQLQLSRRTFFKVYAQRNQKCQKKRLHNLSVHYRASLGGP